MKELFVMDGRSKQEMINLSKPRYNAFAYGYGEIRSQREKEKNRKSKYNQRVKNDIRKAYVY